MQSKEAKKSQKRGKLIHCGYVLFSSGGQKKLSLNELEDSLAQIKAMLKERSTIIENLTPPVADNY